MHVNNNKTTKIKLDTNTSEKLKMQNTNSSMSKGVASDDWVSQINKFLEHENAGDTPVCIRRVRKAVLNTWPEAYTPNYTSLGPYHFHRGELFEMQAYKLLALKHSHIMSCHNKQETIAHFHQLVESLKDQHIAQIRASYDRHLEENETRLAYIMVIDSVFLLEFLLDLTDKNKSCLSKMRSTSHLVDRTESAYHSILQDIMMFENQIPIFVLQHIIIQSCDRSNEYEPNNLLPFMLLKTCKKLSPLKYDESKLKSPKKIITQYSHLLELLYYLIVPETNNNNPPNSSQDYLDDDDDDDAATQPSQSKSTHHHHHHDQKLPINCLPNNILSSIIKMARNIRIVEHCKPLKFILEVAGLCNTTSDVQHFEQNLNDLENNNNNNNNNNYVINGGGGSSSSSSTTNKEAPKVEEIEIPTVSSLVKVGINICCCTNGGSITSIKFDRKTQVLHLPQITIDANTEVVIRNLVAYEAEAVSGPLVLARYTELMNGIIDTAKDVKLLRQRNVLVSYLKKDEDVAQLWNSMSRSIRLSCADPIDKVIKEVNELYNNKTKVKFIRFTKECMVCSWRFLMLLLAMVLMVLMLIQSFCDVYNCPRAIASVAAAPPM